ncbi:MAG TPA: hypothetical protein DCW33_01045 [Proteobacteria bacterium]|nr:hypothetical protein [Pseudomonadota bacterium]
MGTDHKGDLLVKSFAHFTFFAPESQRLMQTNTQDIISIVTHTDAMAPVHRSRNHKTHQDHSQARFRHGLERVVVDG